MSTENVASFLDKVRQDEALAARVATIHQEARLALAETLASLSGQNGTPFTAGEFLAESGKTLSDEHLSGISGGGLFSEKSKARTEETYKRVAASRAQE